MRDVLQVKGYATIEAGTAEDGIALALEQKPDLILMDIQLPGMNGIEALEVLRANPATAAIPVIAVTASVMQQDRKQITEAGFDGLRRQADQSEGIPGSGASRSGEGLTWQPRAGGAVGTTVRDTAHERPGTPRVSTPAKVLVVDDTPHNVKLLADLLAVKGYAVATAVERRGSARQGAPSTKPDLVLLDVMMPGLSGYDVCRRIRANPETALLPVVLVTSLDPQQERVKGIEAGADDFLSKPINQPELFARVRSLLRIKALQDEVRRQAEALKEWNVRARDSVSGSRSPSSSAGPAQALLLARTSQMRS